VGAWEFVSGSRGRGEEGSAVGESVGGEAAFVSLRAGDESDGV
jgi:hypothetical protein